jgi:GntR family transcriptional regulator/MocR family aminotransferase
MRRVLRRSAVPILSYGDPEGPRVLRSALARMASGARGVVASEDDVLVTRGSQMGIDLVARGLLSPGDVVAVEALGYRPAWDALRASGARLVPIPVDGRGLDVDALARLCDESEGRVRGVYVTPHHQLPTTVTLAPSRRLRLLELARARRMFILEDDYDHEFHYEGRPVLPLASADRHGSVIYLGTLSKVLAPGLRIGFLVGPAPLVAHLASIRKIVDRQGDQLLEHAVAELLDEGAIQRHVRRAKRVYAERRARLGALLERAFDGVLSFELPSGGTAIWARVVDREVSADAWADAARARGLVLQNARGFAFDGKSRPFLRLGFAQHDEREVKEAIGRMTSALASLSVRARGRTSRASLASRSSP